MQWTLATSQGPPLRRDALLETSEAENALILYGGRDKNGPLGDLWKYWIANSTWTMIQPAGGAPQPRFSFIGGLDKGRNVLVIFGGELEKKKVVNDLWEFDFTNRQWTQLTPSGVPPKPRYGSAGGIVQLPSLTSVLIVSHGFDKGSRWSDTFSISLGVPSPTWVDVTPRDSSPLPTARCLVGGAVKASGSNFVLGMYGGCGSGGYGPCPSSEFWQLTLANLGTSAVSTQWKMFPTCVRARTQGVLVAHTDFFALYGGSGGPLVANDNDGQLNLFVETAQSWKQVIPSGSSGAVPSQTGYHSAMCIANATNTLWLFLAATSELWRLDTTQYLALPNAEACHTDPIPGWRVAHGVFMALSWGVMLPTGMFIARFGRSRAPLWFHVHQTVQSLGVLFALLGFIISMLMVSEGLFLAYGHSITGLLVTLIGFQQPINAGLRPHVVEGQPKTCRRIWWERLHKNLGRLGLSLGMCNVFVGLSYLGGTSSAAFIVYCIWFCLFVLAFVYLTARGLPWVANGPSRLAQAVNRCLRLEAWGDNFHARERLTSE